MTSIPRRAARRDANEPQIVATFEAAGAVVERLSGCGTPDLLVGFLGDAHLVEVKFETAQLRPEQVAWHARWDKAGPKVEIVRTEAHARKLVRMWTQARALELGALARNDDDLNPIAQVQGKVEDQPA